MTRDMTLPPERITVKRRRDEDPIEALYIQPKKYRPSAVWTLAGSVDNAPAFLQPAGAPLPFIEPQNSRFSGPQVPAVKTTTSSGDICTQTSASSNVLASSTINGSLQPTSTTSPVKQSVQSKQSVTAPRKFHLSKSSLLSSSPYLVSKSPAQKHRKIRNRELAVFVEKGSKGTKAKSARQDHGTGIVSKANTVDEEEQEESTSDTRRKRPNATFAERKWRSTNWDKPNGSNRVTELGSKFAKNISDPSHQWDYESPELLEQLQEIASREIDAQAERAKDHVNPWQLQTKPKPPKPRRPNSKYEVDDVKEDDVMTGVAIRDDDDVYTYDTYVRSDGHPAGAKASADGLADPLQSLIHPNMGLLIIEEGEDEELWETFGEDLDSDPDWNSEEEDENAEDFYGNDYPEDEINPDDEFNRGAYNYRHDASDDEEFDQQEADWSDEEHAAKRPWVLD